MPKLEASPQGKLEFEKIVTCSDLMLPIFDQASRAAQSEATVLITGESGTGKELIAEAIHANSPRRDGPLVVINMAAVPDTLIESELFGHVAGAFTGAGTSRVGRFEAAQGGSLFIDEIGDLAPESQAKLLRVLENHVVTPVGGNEDRTVDVRVIAATNRNLEKMVQEGDFRAELYYRLNVVTIALPPLRHRREDIVPLVEHFFDELSRAYSKPAPVPDAELVAYLESHDWPGNVRQLRNCVESMFVLADGPTLTLDDLPAVVRNQRADGEVPFEVPEDCTLDELARAAVSQALDRYGGNRTHAARSLGISVRTLQRRMKKWNGEGAGRLGGD
jgi:transcriptional regulator with PAS, ATPase and Fis domain